MVDYKRILRLRAEGVSPLWATWQTVDPPPAASLGDAGFVRGFGYYGQGGGQA